MKKIILSLAFIFTIGSQGYSQIKDLSLTFSPLANYTWWSNDSGLEDDYLYGGNVGFAFGEYVELRLTHLRNESIKRDFKGYGLPEGFEDVISANREFDLRRWGGELKANIGSGGLNPYVVLGSGVQTIETDFNTSVDNIYATLGLGIKIGLSDRIALLLEGRNTVLNTNASESLLTDTEKSDLGLTNSSFGMERLYNWNALASLQFYLGGRNPGKLSELDKAYSNKLEQGFKGFTFLFEPAANYVDFATETSIKDTWLLGGYLGFDFNEYLGVRGFYFQSTEDEKLFNDFDNMALYGAELRANLNDGNGVVPYIILGGGYMNIYENTYRAIDNATVTSSEFAKGGLGLEIPVSKYFSINASANSLLTSGKNFENLGDNNELQTNWSYSIGLHLKLGKKADNNKEGEIKQKEGNNDKTAEKSKDKSDKSKDRITDKEKLKQELKEKRRALTKAYNELNSQQKKETQQKIDELKKYYQDKVNSLDKKYKKAVKEERLNDAVNIFEKRKDAQTELNKLKDLERLNEGYSDKSFYKNEDDSTQEKKTADLKISKKKRLNKNSNSGRTLQKSSDRLSKKKKKEKEKEKQKTNSDEKKDDSKKGSELDKDQSKRNIQNTNIEIKVDDSKEKDDTSNKTDEEQSQLKKSAQNKVDQKNKVLLGKMDKVLNHLEENEDEIIRLNKKINDIDRKPNERIVNNKKTIIKTEKIVKEDEGESEKVVKKKVVEKKNEDQNKGDQKEEDISDDITYKREYFNSFDYIKEEAKDNFYIADFLEYKGLSAFLGVNVGRQSTFNVGSRMHYDIKNLSIELMPEVSLGISDPLSFGVALNAVHPFKMELPYNISPYAGIGTGYLYNDEASHLTGNVLIGFYTDAFGGRVYVDYTNRNLFDFNQLAIGYRFNF